MRCPERTVCSVCVRRHSSQLRCSSRCAWLTATLLAMLLAAHPVRPSASQDSLTQLAIGTIVSVVGGIVIASSGKKAEKPATPAIQAGSSDEEKFIANFLKEQEAAEKK